MMGDVNKSAQTLLAARMDERRIQLRRRWDEIAEAAGISAAHLRKVRSGEAAASDLAKANLEQALQWNRGTIDSILSEADSTEDSPQPSAGSDSQWDIDELAIELHKMSGRLFCWSCIQEARIQPGTKFWDWEAVTVVDGVALCVRHVIMKLREDRQRG